MKKIKERGKIKLFFGIGEWKNKVEGGGGKPRLEELRRKGRQNTLIKIGITEKWRGDIQLFFVI